MNSIKPLKLSRFLFAATAFGSFFSAAFAAPATQQALEDLDSISTLPIHTDSISIDLGFPGGGSALGTNSVGARVFIKPDMAISLNLQYSYDKEQQFMAYGGTLRGQWILASKGRSAFYTFGQLSGGATKNTASTNSATTSIVEESSTQTGGAGGAGIEVFLIPEISVSAEVGVGAVFSPSSRIKISTATSQIAIHLFLPQ
jgi:hypothetical protein